MKECKTAAVSLMRGIGSIFILVIVFSVNFLRMSLCSKKSYSLSKNILVTFSYVT